MATEKEIKIGDLVWAKLKGYSPWPGKVCMPPPDLVKSKVKNQHCIWFFGSKNYAWVEERYIKDYQQYKDPLSQTCKTVAFKEACSEIEEYIRDHPADTELSPDPPSDSVSEELLSDLKGDLYQSTMTTKEPNTSATSASTAPRAKKRRSADDSTTNKSPQENLPGSSSQKKTCTRSGRKTASTTPAAASTSFDVPRRSAAEMRLDHSSSFKSATEATLSVNHVSQFLKDKKIVPSNMKFGFLGLGIMGRGIVKNLLSSGHKVTVWNRNPEKCDAFMEAEQGVTPLDVVYNSDITFSCVADPQAAKEILFSNHGVMEGIQPGKSYVVMSGIDPETSKDIEEAISFKGGRYLVAQLQGSKKESEDGQLVILCSGDRSLYDDCLTAFSAMGKTSFFLNNNAESSTKMNLVLQLISGVMVSGLAEGMALADRVGLEMKDVLDVLALTKMSSPFVKEKGQFMADGLFPTQMPLQHMQKDLNLALEMGNSFDQPLPIAAAANEVFKHAKRLGYSEHDCAALYIRARF